MERLTWGSLEGFSRRGGNGWQLCMIKWILDAWSRLRRSLSVTAGLMFRFCIIYVVLIVTARSPCRVCYFELNLIIVSEPVSSIYESVNSLDCYLCATYYLWTLSSIHATYFSLLSTSLVCNILSRIVYVRLHHERPESRCYFHVSMAAHMNTCMQLNIWCVVGYTVYWKPWLCLTSRC